MNRPSIEQQVTFLYTDDLAKTAVYDTVLLGKEVIGEDTKKSVLSVVEKGGTLHG